MINRGTIAKGILGLIFGFIGIQFFLSILLDICPTCFVHMGEDVWCVRFEDGNVTHEKNPRYCTGGMWVTNLSAIPENYSLESWEIMPKIYDVTGGNK